MEVLGQKIAPLGMGCWVIGGPFWNGEQPLGFGEVDDTESINAIHAALDAGVRLFDTAAVYGAGHSERIVGKALQSCPDAIVVTKIGMGFDETTKQISDDETAPQRVIPAIDQCLNRLQRDRIDILLLHLNALPIEKAEPLFAEMEKARLTGKIRSFGWSTDIPASVEALANEPGFIAVEHAMNLFFDAPSMQATIEKNDLVSLVRSPLAMGILTGKFSPTTSFNANDHRSLNREWNDYFVDGQVTAKYLETLNGIKELLQTGGRTVAQGALCWLMAKSDRNISIPGARTVKQMQENAGALTFGPLSDHTMVEIEHLIPRKVDEEPRPR